jgi:hypothetical protein
MKKVIKTMMMLFVASTFVLTSCTSDEDVKDVELTMIPAATSGTHFVSDTLSITLNAKGNADNKLKSIKITKAIAGQAGVITMYENTKLSGTDFIYQLKDTLQPGEAGINTITITLTGEKGNAQTKTYTATVRAIGETVSTGSPVSLFGQGAGAETQQFIALGSFSTFTIGEATANSNAELKNSIDLAFYYGATNKFSLSSLDDAVMHTVYTGLSTFWTSADNSRITGLYKATGQVNYGVIEASLSDKDLLLFAEGKTFSKTINNLAVNDVILFKTKEGKIGLLKVSETTGSTNSTAVLSFDGLVQK